MSPERRDQIEQLYRSALELPLDKQPGFIADACIGDEELRLQVESLLNQYSANAKLLKQSPSPLPSGMRIGPYQIQARLGVGGMGEVYRARDSRLGRDVAIKVLRHELAETPIRRARFEAEARAVAALNHPHIVSIFDFGEVNGNPYAVSELIEGQSLRALLRRGPVPTRKLIDIAVQIAEGLAAAHAAGIAHRDLKPENIMISGDGRIKILDFGLARSASRTSGALNGNGATVTVRVTQPGTVLGTPNYMSPEQARGEVADYRSDQFSFGLVLYELATSKLAFEKNSTVETLAAIVREEPVPIDRKIPAPLRWAIDRCLAKEPQERYESTRDLYEDLRSLRDHLSDAYTSSELSEARPGQARVSGVWKTVALTGIVMSALALCAAVLLASRDAGTNLAEYRYRPLAIDAKLQGAPIWSPDGKAVAYQALLNGQYHIFVRYIASPVATDLGIHRDYAKPRHWSADSRRVFFSATTPASTPQNPKRGFYSISAIGGDPAFIMDRPKDAIATDFSPDVRELAVFCRCDGNKFSVFFSSPLGSPWRRYGPDPFATMTVYNGTDLKFAPDGKKAVLLYTGVKQEPEAWVLPFPPGSSQPRRTLTEIPTRNVLQGASWMPDSRHLVISMSAGGNDHLWLADTDSNRAYQITTGTSSESDAGVSPDGKTVAFNKSDVNLNVISVSLVDDAIHMLVGTERNERMAAWAARAQELAYVTDRNGPMEVWIRSENGLSRPAVTQDNFPDSRTHFIMDPALSPDGSRLVFARQGPDGAIRNWIISLSEGVPHRLNESATDTEYGGAWSPDGRRFAYLQVSGKSMGLAVATVGSADVPILLRREIWASLPDWSPTNEWISFQNESGWNLISPDGKTVKPLGKISTQHLAFSRDAKQLFGVRQEHSRVTLFSLDLATLKVKDVRELGEDLAPSSDYSPGIRFSVAPDGKSIAYSAADMKSSLWLLEGFQQPSLLQRLFGPTALRSGGTSY